MKWSRLCLLLLPAVCMACKSAPSGTPVEIAEPSEAAAEANVIISQELYDLTLAEVRGFVDGINTMIQDKNYAAWKDTLADEHFTRISSPEFLALTSESPALKTRKIVLKTPEDYFINVVVPSRGNSKVDEIEFITANRVKVFYLENWRNNATGEMETRRLRLYDLIKDDDTWKIID